MTSLNKLIPITYYQNSEKHFDFRWLGKDINNLLSIFYTCANRDESINILTIISTITSKKSCIETKPPNFVSMQVLTQFIKPSNGRITISIPDDFANKELEVTIRPLPQNAESAAADENKYDFSDLVGKLQWKGDALKEQQKLRNEWS